MVAQLRAADAPALHRETGKLLNAIARVGVFRLGGTHAFRLYSAELGVRFPANLAVAGDVDIAAFENLKLVIEDEVDPPGGYVPRPEARPRAGPRPKQKSKRWVMTGGGTIGDFPVPRMRGEDETALLKSLEGYAQALSFLNFLIAEPIPAVGLYRSGVLVQIPRPERYAIHKLIVASRRHASSAAKAQKDLAQAEMLIQILAEDRPGELREAYELAMSSGPKWREAIEAAMARAPVARHVVDKNRHGGGY